MRDKGRLQLAGRDAGHVKVRRVRQASIRAQLCRVIVVVGSCALRRGSRRRYRDRGRRANGFAANPQAVQEGEVAEILHRVTMSSQDSRAGGQRTRRLTEPSVSALCMTAGGRASPGGRALDVDLHPATTSSWTRLVAQRGQECPFRRVHALPETCSPEVPPSCLSPQRVGGSDVASSAYAR